jgi:hypothetical protein
MEPKYKPLPKESNKRTTTKKYMDEWYTKAFLDKYKKKP